METDCSERCGHLHADPGVQRPKADERTGAPSPLGTRYITDNVSLHKRLLSLSVSVI